MPADPRPRLTLLYVAWCPHCVPLSTELAPRFAARRGLPLRQLDVDRPADEEEGDRLVAAVGDDPTDYLVPQLFLEAADGRVTRLLLAQPGSTAGTRAAWERLLAAA